MVALTRLCQILAIVLLAGILLANVNPAASPSLATDRARVQVQSVADPLGGPPLRVLRTDQNTPLRAGTAWIWSKQWQEEPPEYYAAMRGKGLNAVRIILFDTWEHEAGYGGGDWSDPAYRVPMLDRIERAVNLASKNGLYAVINSHNRIPNYDVAYSRELWRHVAQRFANRRHVIFEASNEALRGTYIQADGTFGGSMDRLRELRGTHDLIRQLAPESHIMVLTPAGISGYGHVDALARLTEVFENLPGTRIDWTRTSVAYHLYHGDENLFPQAQNLRAFHSRYPGWPSENNFPRKLTNEQLGIVDDWRGIAFGDDVFITQTMERFGLGWSHWNMNRMEHLNRNFPFKWNDAVEKGYTWRPDHVVNDIRFVNAGGPSVERAHYDLNFFRGQTASRAANLPIDTSRVQRPAPTEAYRTERWGEFEYQFAHLPHGVPVQVRLHFAETFEGITGPGQRIFNVVANGRVVVNRLDVFAAAGGRNRAIVREFWVRPDAQGRITLSFRPVLENAKVNAIELVPRRTQ